MKVTNVMTERNFLYNISKIESNLLRLEDQATKGKYILLPQDDPVGTERAISLRHHLSKSRQYLRNLDRARIFINERERALADLTEVLFQVNQLSMTAATATTPDEARDVIAREIEQLKEAAQEISQRTVQDRKVLLGTIPSWEVSSGIVIKVEGMDDFIAEVDEKFEKLLGALYENDTDAIQDVAQEFRALEDLCLGERVKSGAQEARLDNLEDRMGALDLEYETLLSKAEDVDLAEIVTRLKISQAAYQAALAVGATLIQPSLLDHLR